MLAVPVEDEDVFDFSAFEKRAQSGLDRSAFTLIHWVANDFRAGFSRLGLGRIRRTVIDHQHVIELRERAAGDVLNALLFEVTRDQRSNVGAVNHAGAT